MQHELKTDAEQYEMVEQGFKSFEIRKDDRNFRVGDSLLLRETAYTGEQMKQGHPLLYTGRSMAVIVQHILKGPIYGLADGWVIMSIRPDKRSTVT